MIYEIYIKCHDEKYSPSFHTSRDNKPKDKDNKLTFRASSIDLQPYHVPQNHYNTKKLANSLHQLSQHVKQSKDTNTYLATKILFTHGKQETRKFLHRTKQLFGDKIQALRKRKFMASASDTLRHSNESCPQVKSKQSFISDEELYFEKYRPDFTIRNQKKQLQIRCDRRKTLGIEEADLKNYEDIRRGLLAKMKRKQARKDVKNFREINMKGFAAKITANLQTKQKVSTGTLVRLMNLNIKCIDEDSLRYRYA